MALKEYNQKRKFAGTPEPRGGKATSTQLRFVIQKHAATRLHYDFRLEMEGVLKSWAVPKGPSLNPEDKRLAMMVEDHPYDYRDFEGIIPEGNYGAGTVIVWDEGFYEPLESSGSKAKDDKALIKQLDSGSIKIRLNGHKLKGEFALVRLKNAKQDNAWLLIKHRDQYAKTTEVTRHARSVTSGKTLEQVTKTTTHFYGKPTITPGTTAKKAAAKKSAGKAAKRAATNKGTASKAAANQAVNKQVKKTVPVKRIADTKALTTTKAAVGKVAKMTEKTAKPKKAAKKTTTAKAADKKKQTSLLKKATEATFPVNIKPMLATLVDKPFDDAGWLYEIKWDGYRALALCNKGTTELVSRNNKSFNEKFFPVYKAIKDWGIQAVVDGEICVLSEKGIAHFGSLQNWRSEADGELVYYLFDILWLDGYDVSGLPLSERRALLEPLIPKEGIIRFSENFHTSATQFLQAAMDMGMEGIIAKKAGSTYLAGERTANWLKIKANKRHDVVIGGYTRNEDSPKQFSSLLVGVYDDAGNLQYTGKIGTGFNTKMQDDMMKRFSRLVTKTCPFTEVPDVNKPSRFRSNPPHATVTWLKPKLVCEVSYAEITGDGVMRHPSFEGMREDKDALSVQSEKAVAVKEVVTRKTNPAEKVLRKGGKEERKTLLNPSESSQTKKINGHELNFSNVHKIYWPKEGYTKGDMLNYYYRVAPYIMPYLKDRPQSLNRFPNGIDGHSFYHKDLTGQVPEWMQLFPYHTSEGEDKNFMVPTDEAALLYMANLGAIEMNPWNSTIHNPDAPDWCLIDLDPTEKNSFEQVIKTAQVAHEILEESGVASYVKTSGSTGIHIYIPLGAQYTYDESQLFARMIATQVHERLPEFTSIERMTNKRKNRIYVDFLQNRPKATLAAPYSLRPKPGATVSMPLHWEEVKKGLQMKDFTIENALDRIKESGDIFKPVLGKGINMSGALKKLEQPA